jgi:hypothetical protein
MSKIYTDEELDALPNKWRIEYFENGEWIVDWGYPFKDGAETDAKFFAEGIKWRVLKI